MGEIINTIINLIKEKNYTVLIYAITVLLFVLLFILLRRATIKSTKVKTKRTNKYINLLIQYRKNASNATDCKCYYDLLSYVDDDRDYKRIEYYIEHNDNGKIQKYIKSEMYKLRRENLKNADGPDYSVKSIKNTMHRFQIYDSIILPTLFSLTILYCVFMMVFCVVSSNNVSFVLGLIFVAILIVTIIYSFSIIMTDRFSFDPVLIRICYVMPFLVWVILSELSVPLNWLSIISIMIYLVFLIVLNHNRKNSTIDISKAIHKFKTYKLDLVLSLQCTNDINENISRDEKTYTFAYFDLYSLVAVYQYSIFDGKVTLFNSFEDVSILDHKEKIKSEVNELVKKKFKTDTIYPIS